MPRKRSPHGRTPQPRRRASRGPGPRAEDQPLFQSLRRALRSDDPLELVALVSGFLEITDPRSRDPFAREEAPGHALPDLVASLVGTPYAETTAALTVLRSLTPDDVLRADLDRVLSERRHPMPAWLQALDQARVESDVWRLTHTLGDGDDYLLGVRLPSGDEFSALVYVDHNLGLAVKDAFVVPQPLEDLVIRMGTLLDEDQSLTRVDPATARAVLVRAIDLGARTYPPLTSDSWPMCRPVVEWMLRMLPVGGEAPDWREWTPEETAEVTDEFFASPYADGLRDDEHRSLLESVLWFCTSDAPGDPYRWSPVTVEILLADWFPRKVVADADYLRKLPDLVRAYIRYCHDRSGIRAGLTADTLAAVDTYEPVYLEQIADGASSPAAALAAALLESERLRGLDDDEWFVEYAAREVGGRNALMALDDEPLPDEPFDWTGIPDEVHGAVAAILEQVDRVGEEVLDIEHRTAMRRLLARAARNEPKVFARKGSPARGAAALAWIIGVGNRTVGAWSADLTTQELLAHFGVTGSVSDRGATLARAAGVSEWFTSTDPLGDPALLVSSRRRAIIRDRDRRR